MAFYILQRFGLGLATLGASLVILFCMIYVIPGDPVAIALGPRATPEMREIARERMGLDQPVVVQLVRFVANAAKGDLGVDVWSGQSVGKIVAEAMPSTLVLIAVSLGWAVLIAIPLGCISAARPNGTFDALVGIVSIGTITLPSFVVAIYGLLVFSVALHWLPAVGAGRSGDFKDQLLHLLLPSLAVGLGWVGYLARMVRASMIEVLGERHILTARSFGLPEHLIVTRYALPLAILPTLTLIGVGAGRLLSNAVFAELVFNRPGLGLLIYNASLTRNYPVVMGTVFVTVILFVLFSLLSDLLIALVDPRVRDNL